MLDKRGLLQLGKAFYKQKLISKFLRVFKTLSFDHSETFCSFALSGKFPDCQRISRRVGEVLQGLYMVLYTVYNTLYSVQNIPTFLLMCAKKTRDYDVRYPNSF